MTERPVDPKSVDLILAAIINEITQGTCRPGRVCGQCDCFAGPATFERERKVAEQVLRQGIAMFARIDPESAGRFDLTPSSDIGER